MNDKKLKTLSFEHMSDNEEIEYVEALKKRLQLPLINIEEQKRINNMTPEEEIDKFRANIRNKACDMMDELKEEDVPPMVCYFELLVVFTSMADVCLRDCNIPNLSLEGVLEGVLDGSKVLTESYLKRDNKKPLF